MPFPILENYRAISLEQMKQVDYHSIDRYGLPIRLMMENAGLHLARLAMALYPQAQEIVVGAGAGNNGGGGLVAARRLAAWGKKVFLDLPNPELKELPAEQLERALAFGVTLGRPENPDLAIDAYFGFSLRLPLPEQSLQSMQWMNALNVPIVSLDLPSGLTAQSEIDDFRIQSDAVLSLAAVKSPLLPLLSSTRIFTADLGIPRQAFLDLQLPEPPEFGPETIFEIQAT